MLTVKQKEYINNSNHRYNIKIGATRSGKTYLDIIYTIASRIRERKDYDGLNVILGVSKGTIERNVLEPMRERFGNLLVGTIGSNNTAKIFGQQVYCLGAEKVNQVSKIRGASIKYCYCDELAEYNEEVWELLKSRLDKPYSCLDATLNPENKHHWLKVDFLDTIEEKGIDAYIQYYTIFDNTFLSKEFVDNICKEYEGTVYYNRYILGQWCDAEGIIFRQIADNKSRYITKETDYDFVSIGIDWGGNGSAHSITATGIKRDYTSLQVLASDKMEATGTDTKQLFRWIINFITKIIDKYGMITVIYCDSAEQVLINSLNSELQAKGIYIPVKNSVKTPIKDRIEAINRILNLDIISFIDGETMTCIEALQTAVYDEKASEDRWLDDGTSDIDSLDSFVYSWEYWMPNIVFRIGGNI